MEKLLIIGAGIGQLPLLRKAKANNIHVTVVSIPGNYPCFYEADDIIYKDIYDRDGIVNDARERGITAVVSDQNDLMNPTVAYVAEKLGLPGNKFETVMKYCNKNAFRDMCEKADIPVPRHVAIKSLDFDYTDFDCPFPWIIKPADSQSSIGVQRIDKIENLFPALEAALSKSPTHEAILEEYFEGHEIVCEGIIDNGKYYLLSFADRKYFNIPDLMIPSQTLFPSTVKKELLDKIVEYETRLARYTNPHFAIVHAEYLVNLQSGEIRIVESALRGGGVYISSDLIPLATGIDINEMLLNKSRGIDIDIDDIFTKKKQEASAYICFYLPNGIIEEINGVGEVKTLSYVDKVFLDNIVVGNQTEPMTYKGARKGPILVWGRDRNELEKNILQVQSKMEIKVRLENGDISGIIWE